MKMRNYVVVFAVVASIAIMGAACQEPATKDDWFSFRAFRGFRG
jgi:hypothetical protein